MRKLIFIFGLLWLLSSCTEVLDLDPRSKFVVVHSVLTNDTVQTVELRYTSYLSEDYMPAVETAQVWVEEENGDGSVKSTYQFVKSASGLWISHFFPSFATRYNLYVEVPGHERIEASTIFPFKETMIGLTADRRTYAFRANNLPLYLWVHGVDYYQKTKTYQVVPYIFGTAFVQNDHFYDLVYKEDVVIEDYPCIDTFNQSEVLVGQLPALSESFAAALHPEEPVHHRYLRVELGTSASVQLPFYGKIHLVALPSFVLQANGFPDSRSLVVFDSVSEDYDRYLKYTLDYALSQNKELTDFSQLYGYKELSTNVKNGVGIFGALYRQQFRASDLYHQYEGGGQ
ncbi:MAG: DUF4249 family protein [Bacteroidales bacterium]|nr:DUF4249 family protein [Bacteroidales bacterium]